MVHNCSSMIYAPFMMQLLEAQAYLNSHQHIQVANMIKKHLIVSGLFFKLPIMFYYIAVWHAHKLSAHVHLAIDTQY